jgi:hypothetical protein
LKSAKSGSSLSTKQLGFAVKEGRQVHFEFPDREPITGYICGMDDFHWMVITPQGNKKLIHKGSASAIELPNEATYDTEPQKELLDSVVLPFRRWVLRTLFDQGEECKACDGTGVIAREAVHAAG